MKDSHLLSKKNFDSKKDNMIFQNEIKNNNDNFQNNNLEKIDYEEQNTPNLLTEEEINKAKENCFILLGKTGVGKTSLLNIIYGKDIGKVGHTSLSETKNSNYYCIKEKIQNQYIYFCIIDTPGLYDTSGVEADEKQKKEIIALISSEKIKVKGLLFLSNFQNERLDASEQYTLIEYIKMFPLKDFWKRIIFVFTHYYGDPDSYSKEEIKENNNIYKSQILQYLMNKVKNICSPIQFKDLNLKYINMFNRNLNEKKIKNNLEIRKEMIAEMIKYIKLKPMFNKLQIFNFENYEIEKDDKYLYNCDLYIYLDSNNNIIHQEFRILNKIPKNIGKDKEQNVMFNIEECAVNENGCLIKKTTKKEGYEKIFKDHMDKIGGGLTIFSLVGFVLTGIFFPYISFASLVPLVGGAYLLNKNRVEKEEEKKLKEEVMTQQKILELIKNELEKFE